MPLSSTQAKTILILDVDLGRQFWLGEVLVSAGYRVVPAQSVLQAASLIAQFNLVIDLLIVDPSLTGIADFVRGLQSIQGKVRILATVEPSAELGDEFGVVEVVRVNATSASDFKALAEEWVRSARSLLP
jgi:hypothetical protein